MKKLLSITLGAVFAVVATTSAFAQCSSGHVTADLGEQLYLSEKIITETAMSTHDPSDIELELALKKLKAEAEAAKLQALEIAN